MKDSSFYLHLPVDGGRSTSVAIWPALGRWIRAHVDPQLLEFITMLCASVIVYNFSYITNPNFNPSYKVIVLLYGVWVCCTYLLDRARLIGFLKMAWPLLVWAAQVYVRSRLRTPIYKPAPFAILICMAVSISYWYIKTGSRILIRCLVIIMLAGLVHCSLISIRYLLKFSSAIRVSAMSKLPSVYRGKGIGTFGYVYGMVYVLLLLLFAFVERLRARRWRSAVLGAVLLGIMGAAFVLARFMIAYALLAVGLVLFFVFGKNMKKRLLITGCALLVLYWPAAQLMKAAAGMVHNRFIQIRLVEVSSLMLGRLNLASDQSALLARSAYLQHLFEIIARRPIFGSLGRWKWLSFHHDFQWIGDYALYGIFSFLFLYFIFFSFNRFVRQQSDAPVYRSAWRVMLIVLAIHGALNRLYANDLLAIFFILVPLMLNGLFNPALRRPPETGRS